MATLMIFMAIILVCSGIYFFLVMFNVGSDSIINKIFGIIVLLLFLFFATFIIDLFFNLGIIL